MTTDEQLRDALEKWREGARQAQLRWVTVDKVDKENKAMDVTGVIDQLEYYDVQLGMGALCIYPKPGTTCLVGIIEGQETDAFLISADEVDEIVLNGGTLGGLVKVGELTERLNLIGKGHQFIEAEIVRMDTCTERRGIGFENGIVFLHFGITKRDTGQGH